MTTRVVAFTLALFIAAPVTAQVGKSQVDSPPTTHH